MYLRYFVEMVTMVIGYIKHYDQFDRRTPTFAFTGFPIGNCDFRRPANIQHAVLGQS